MKIKLYLFISLIFLSLLICSCNKSVDFKEDFIETEVNQQVENITIPLIFYSNNKALKGEWNITNGMLTVSEEYYYKFQETEEHWNFIPLLWDGYNQFFMYNNLSAQHEDLVVSYLSETNHGKQQITTGENVILYSLEDNSGYIIEYTMDNKVYNVLFNNEVIVDQNGEECNIINNSTQISFIQLFNSEITLVISDFNNFRAYIAQYDLNSNIWNYQSIDTKRFEYENARSFPIIPEMCTAVNDKVYFKYGGDISSIDLDTHEFNIEENINNKYSEINNNLGIVNSNEYDATTVTSVDEILLIYTPVSYGEHIQNVLYAFREDKFLGALYIKDEDYSAYNSLGNNFSGNIDITYSNIILPTDSNSVYTIDNNVYIGREQF